MNMAGIRERMNGTVNRLEEWFRTSDVGKQFAAEQEQSVATDRTVRVDELRKSEAQKIAVYQQAEKALPKAKAAVDAARVELKKAEATIATIENAKRSGYWAAEVFENQIRSQLLETADPRIDAFIFELRDQLDRRNSWMRTGEPVEIRRAGFSHWVTPTNRHAVVRRLDAYRDAIAQAERLRFEDYGTDPTARIQEIRDGIEVAAGALDTFERIEA